MKKSSLITQIMRSFIPILLISVFAVSAVLWFVFYTHETNKNATDYRRKITDASIAVERILTFEVNYISGLKDYVFSEIIYGLDPEIVGSYLAARIEHRDSACGTGVFFHPDTSRFIGDKYNVYAYKPEGEKATYTDDYDSYYEENYLNSAWYLASANSLEEPRWSGTVFEKLVNDDVYSVSQSLFDEDGRYLGVVESDVSKTYLLNLVLNTDWGKSDNIILFDCSGFEIYRDIDQKNNNVVSNFFDFISGNTEYSSDFLNGLSDENFNEQKIKNTHTIDVFSLDGKDIYFEYIPELEWAIGIVRDTEDTRVDAIFKTIPFTLLTFLIATTVIAFPYMRLGKARSRYDTLDNLVRRIIGGDYTARAFIPGNDEFSRLAKNMNRMAETLDVMVTRHKMVVENSPQIIVTFDSKFNVTGCNPNALKAFGYKTEEELKANYMRDVEEAIRDNDAGHVTLMERMLKCSIEGQCEYITKYEFDGREVWLQTTYLKISHRGDFEMLIYSRDITALHNAHETQKIIQNSTKQHMYFLDENMELIGINTAAIETFGYKNEKEALSRWLNEIDDMIPYEERNNMYGSVVDAAKYARDNDINVNTETTIFINEQRTVWNVLVARVPLQNGKFGAVIFANNITEFRNAVSRAEDATRAKSTFLSQMSHEIRTPLNAIMGMTQIGTRSDSAEKKTFAFEKIEEASEHLLGVINDILDISKIEARKFEISNNEFDLEKAFKKAVTLSNFRASEKNINFTVDFSSNLPHFVIGDDQRFAQVCINLLSNAIKFTQDGGDVSLSAKMIDSKDNENQDFVIIETVVKDNGIGMTEEQMSRLFTSFEQADASITRKFGGTGLGLAISQFIAELMAGNITVKSSPGNGSEFTFTAILKKGSPKEDEALIIALRENLRIMVIDDENYIRDYFSDFADETKLNIETASGGKDAFDKIAKNGPYDIYFIDWRMPGTDGLELAKKIKQNNEGVVIMFSSADLSLIEKEAEEIGVTALLPKPLFSSDIIDAINKCCGEIVKSQEPSNTIDFSGKTILIAEDVDVNQVVIEALLENTGVTIDFADNGKIALERFTKYPSRYSLIFMDVHMPEMDGYEATRRIRQLSVKIPRAETIPIIAITANVFREDIEKCLSSGMNAHISKPINLPALLDLMTKYLGTEN